MSSDRLSYAAPLPSPLHWPGGARTLAGDALRALGARVGCRAKKPIAAARRQLSHEGSEPVTYYTNAESSLGTSARPLLLLHGMHLNAGAHDFAQLFAAFRAERPIYVPDLPGFAASPCASSACEPARYVATVKQLIELCASELLAPVDVVAVGLSCEYAAQAVATLPDMVNSLTLIEPTGFASVRAESVLERLARSGNTFLPLAVLERLGLTHLCSGGFASLLSGAAFPRGNAQTAYTRVHCPALVLHAESRRARYGTLARFVRWRDHYQEQELASTNLSDRSSVQNLVSALTRFFAPDTSTQEAPALRAG